MGESQKKNKLLVMKLPLTNYEKVLEFLSGIGVLLLIIIVIGAWKNTPEQIPSHFGPSGRPDAWGGKGSLALLPILGLMIYLLITVVSRFPSAFNYPCKITEENAKVQYQLGRYLLVLLKVEIIWLFIYIEWKTIQVAIGKAERL